MRDEALDILCRFQWNVYEAASGSAKKGFLGNDHLKQLAIHKGVYHSVGPSGATPNKMQLVKMLGQSDSAHVRGDRTHGVGGWLLPSSNAARVPLPPWVGFQRCL